VVVALGEPGLPLISWARVCRATNTAVVTDGRNGPMLRSLFLASWLCRLMEIQIRRLFLARQCAVYD
jgi:hypothetical protein